MQGDQLTEATAANINSYGYWGFCISAKPPDLPAVGTRLFYVEDADNEAFFATVTRQHPSREAAPGQWVVQYRSGDYDGEDYDIKTVMAGAMGCHLQLQSPQLQNSRGHALFGRLGSLQVPNGAQSEPWPESARPSRTKGGAVLTQARPLGQQTGEAPVG